jgi:hypothetical protein
MVFTLPGGNFSFEACQAGEEFYPPHEESSNLARGQSRPLSRSVGSPSNIGGWGMSSFAMQKVFWPLLNYLGRPIVDPGL